MRVNLPEISKNRLAIGLSGLIVVLSVSAALFAEPQSSTVRTSVNAVSPIPWTSIVTVSHETSSAVFSIPGATTERTWDKTITRTEYIPAE